MRENYFVAIFSALFLGCRVRLHTRSDDGCASSCGELFMKAGWHREIILFREDLKDSKDNSNNNQQPPASSAHHTFSALQAAGMGSPRRSVTRWCLALHCYRHQLPAPMLRWPRRLLLRPRYPSSIQAGEAEHSDLGSASLTQLRLRPECDGARQWLAAVRVSGSLLPVRGCQHQLIQSKINTRAGHN